MATITNAVLSLTHNHEKKTVRAVVRCTVNFTPLELCQMKTCSGRWFKLKCQVWGSEKAEPWFGGDDLLFTYANVFFFPDATPAATETKTFDVLLGEGVLDEDWGRDEVYGKLILVNLATLVSISKKTNIVPHHF